LLLKNLQKIGLIAKKYFKARCGGFSKKKDLEEENDSRCNENIERRLDS
jgi:hypothetical protein